MPGSFVQSSGLSFADGKEVRPGGLLSQHRSTQVIKVTQFFFVITVISDKFESTASEARLLIHSHKLEAQTAPHPSDG